MFQDPLTLIVVCAILVVAIVAFLANRYRKCPADKILVIYGSGNGAKKSAICVHGGGAFVWPVIQDYAYMSLTPIGIDANLTNALSRQNIRVDVPCRFTVGISTDPEYMNAAAERLLGQTANQIQEMARDILFGQLRLVIATMSIEELNSDRDKFLEAITANVEVELKKIGLKLINVNVTDIKDESGYIEALGQEAAAKAINEAKVRVAEQEKIGEIGKAEAIRETRIRTAAANAEAVKQEIEKKRLVIEAEAAAEQKRVNAKGEADAIYAKMEAEAKGLFQILTKQAEGYDKMIQAAGGDATKAYTLLLLEKLPELVKTQVEAIKGINIDKVTVWDNGGNADGKGSTANFLSGLMKSVPPLNELFEQAGMSLPEYLGKKAEEPKQAPAEESETEE